MAADQKKRQLHIVHTESSLGWGGQEMRILSEALGFMQRGHRLTLLTPSSSTIYGAAIKAGIETVALPMEKKRLKGVMSLRKWLADNNPDIVNTHSSTDSWLVALAKIGMQDIPMVRTRHLSAAVPGNFATRWLYASATNYTVTTGESIRQMLIRDNHFDGANISAIPTGIDVDRFVPGDKLLVRSELGLPADEILIGIVATIRSWKGHQYLIEALSKIKNDNVRLLIIGDGPIKDVVEKQIDELGLSDKVLMAGQQEDVVPWLQAMDIFVLPSYANEGVPQAVLQAMLCEKAIVTTDAGSISEAVEHEQSGLIVDKKSSEAIATALELLMSDASLSERLGKQARLSAAANYSFESMLDKMEKVFYSVVK